MSSHPSINAKPSIENFLATVLDEPSPLFLKSKWSLRQPIFWPKIYNFDFYLFSVFSIEMWNAKHSYTVVENKPIGLKSNRK